MDPLAVFAYEAEQALPLTGTGTYRYDLEVLAIASGHGHQSHDHPVRCDLHTLGFCGSIAEITVSTCAGC